jgi:hypothetical protein
VYVWKKLGVGKVLDLKATKRRDVEENVHATIE